MKLIPLAIAALVAFPFAANAQTTVFSDIIAYGKKCGEISILPSHALIGKNFTVTTKSKDANTGLVAIGLKRANFDLGNGCGLFVQPLFVSGWGSTTKGTGTLTFPVPNRSSLLGFKFTIQTSANNSNGVGISRGIEAKIGNKQPEE